MFAANKYYFLKQYRLRNIFSITILQIEIQAPDCLMQRFQVTSAWKTTKVDSDNTEPVY